MCALLVCFTLFLTHGRIILEGFASIQDNRGNFISKIGFATLQDVYEETFHIIGTRNAQFLHINGNFNFILCNKAPCACMMFDNLRDFC